MSHSDYIAHRWLNEFVRARGLSGPTREPLFMYGCSVFELEGAKRILAGGLRPQNTPGEYLSAMFCLFASEWLRRNYSGGPWSWDPVYEALGHSQEDANPRELVRKGLRYWGRKVLNHPDRRLFLVSVVLEGGLPLQVIRTGKGRFAAYLKRVLWEVSRYEARASVAPEIAASHAGMIPSRFRHQVLYALAGDLVCSVLACRDMLPPREDPIVWLDSHRPDWRSTFPLPVDDADARALLSGLIRESASISAKGTKLNALVERVLEGDGERYAFKVAFLLSGELDAGALPDAIRSDLGDARRARLFADERLGFDGPLALLRREPREGGDVWILEPFHSAATTVPWPPYEPVAVRLRVDGRDSREFVPPGGEALDDGLWVFDCDDVEGSPERLRLFSCGSVRSRRRTLHVSLPVDDRYAVQEGELAAVGRIANPDRPLFRIVAPVRLSEVGSDLAISLRPAADSDGAIRLSVGGTYPRWHCDAPMAVLGEPRVWVASADGTLQQANVGSLRWRVAGRGGWERWQAERLPFGMLEVAVIRDGALAARARVAHFPANARANLEPEGNAGGWIRFVGFEGAWIGPTGDTPAGVRIGSERAGDVTSLRFAADGSPPSEITIEARWDDRPAVRFRLPFPVRGGGFVDAQGRWIAPGSVLPLDGLHGVRAKASASGHAILFADLQGGDAVAARRAFLRVAFEEETSLIPYKQAFLRLLSNASNSGIDASVRVIVQTGGRESRDVRISRFDASFVREEEGLRLPGVAADTMAEVVARPIGNLAAVEIGLVRDGDLWRLPEGSGAGPWLVYGRIDGQHRIRPTILGSVGIPEGAEGLARAILIANHDERAASIEDCINRMAEDPQSQDWPLVDGALDALAGKLPFAAWDTFPRLSANPYALQVFLSRLTSERLARAFKLEDEFPFMWTMLPLDGWTHAFGEVHRRRRAQYEELGAGPEQAETVAGMLLDETLQGLVDTDPAMFGVAAIVTERLGRQFGNQPPPSALPDQAIQFLIADARQAAQKRNADERNLPAGFDFREGMAGLPDEHLQVSEFARPLLDAPFAAARIAATAKMPNREAFLAIRQCRDFDPAWFEAAFSLALARECRATISP